METTSKPQERENPFQINSPNSNGSTNMSSSFINCNNNGGAGVQQLQTQAQPPLTPKQQISRSDHQTNPYPTTFVQADTSTFKQVVQRLTGSSKPNPDFLPNKNPIPPVKTSSSKKQQGFKLYERRNQLKNNLMINPNLVGHGGGGSSFSPRMMPEILSPSLLDFPNKLVLSPVTPLNEDVFVNSSSNNNNNNKPSSSTAASSSEEEEEKKAIAEKGFYLHPSPISTPRECEPQLLPLFPVTSPRVSASSSSTNGLC